MNSDLNSINQPVANSARSLLDIHRQQEKSARDEAKAKQEKLERDKRIVTAEEAQIVLLQKQNAKLMEMYDAQVAANAEAKEELKRSKCFNVKMMIISIIAMLGAIASPIVTYLVSR